MLRGNATRFEKCAGKEVNLTVGCLYGIVRGGVWVIFGCWVSSFLFCSGFVRVRVHGTCLHARCDPFGKRSAAQRARASGATARKTQDERERQ